MIRWLPVIFLSLLVFTILVPDLRKLGVGRVFGDVELRLGRRRLLLPFGSTVVVFLVVLLVAQLQSMLA